MQSERHGRSCATSRRRFPGGAFIHWLQRLDEATVAQARPLVRTLFLSVMVVLFIACANLAGLLLVRVIGRRREISVRLALGASGAAVLRQSLGEVLLLSMGGGLLGLALAWLRSVRAFAFCLRRCRASAPSVLIGRSCSLRLDWRCLPAACAA